MSLELMPRGLDNNIKIKMVYVDTKEEEVFKSIAAANRKTNINAKSIRDALNPIAKKRFEFNGRIVVFRIKK
jgi:hypothetical protein